MTAGLAALLVSAAACDAPSSADRPPPRPSASISGRAIPSASCDARPAQRVRVARRMIRLVVLCPMSVEPGPVVRLRPGSTLFAPAVLALATPGRHYPPGTACPAYADVAQTVLAQAGKQWLVVDLPQDSCGHYPRDLLALLAHARAAA